MMYYARTNTADPRVGLITVGEYLTDAQVKALGKDLLCALVQRGVLGRVCDDAPSAPSETGDNGTDGATGDGVHGDGADAAPEDDGEEDGAPELSVSDVIVNDAEEAAKAEPKKTRRNSK